MLETKMLLTAAIVIAVVAAILVAVPAPILPGECKIDSDCAIGGCSGQVCTKATDASSVITTCEWREEYGCLQSTTCGCVNARCEWRNTTAYQDCMRNISG